MGCSWRKWEHSEDLTLPAPMNRASHELAKSMRTWISSIKSNRRQGRQKLQLTLKWRPGCWWCIVFFAICDLLCRVETSHLAGQLSCVVGEQVYQHQILPTCLCVISTRWGPYQSQMRAPINGRKSIGFRQPTSSFHKNFGVWCPSIFCWIQYTPSKINTWNRQNKNGGLVCLVQMILRISIKVDF